MSDPEVRLIERLQEPPPPFAEGVSFAEVKREVTRYRRKRALGMVGGGAAALALGFGMVTGGLLDRRPLTDPTTTARPSTSVPSSPSSPVNLALANPVELCPDSVIGDRDVPSIPFGDLGENFVASRQLVPTTVPVSAVLCTYQIVTFAEGRLIPTPSVGANHPLHSAVRVRAGLDRLAKDLSRRPAGDMTQRVCTLMAGAVNVMLLRLDYAAGGTVWVKTETDVNGCMPATNGSFVTTRYLGEAFALVSQAGAWQERWPTTWPPSWLPADRP